MRRFDNVSSAQTLEPGGSFDMGKSYSRSDFMTLRISSQDLQTQVSMLVKLNTSI